MDIDYNRDFLYGSICGNPFRVPVFKRVWYLVISIITHSPYNLS